jgi:XapX domain-containing protein
MAKRTVAALVVAVLGAATAGGVYPEADPPLGPWPAQLGDVVRDLSADLAARLRRTEVDPVTVLLALVTFAGTALLHARSRPLPAPPVLVGALLVLAMTLGYEAVDRLAQARAAAHSANCGGHDGAVRGAIPPRIKKDMQA